MRVRYANTTNPSQHARTTVRYAQSKVGLLFSSKRFYLMKNDINASSIHVVCPRVYGSTAKRIGTVSYNLWCVFFVLQRTNLCCSGFSLPISILFSLQYTIFPRFSSNSFKLLQTTERAKRFSFCPLVCLTPI